MNEAYLCLGGNLGNCSETFAESISLLSKKEIIIISKSPIYKSEAWGMPNAPDFYNQVLRIKTPKKAGELLQLLLTIEKELGRERTFGGSYASRTLDLDILFFNDEIINEEHLHVPHPRLYLRKFVLEPLNEIATNLIHPVLKKTVGELLSECPDKSKVEKLNDGV